MPETNKQTVKWPKFRRYINEFTPRKNNKLYIYAAGCYVILTVAVMFFSLNHCHLISSLGISIFGSLCARSRQVMFNCCNSEDISSPGICVGNYLFFCFTGAITTGLVVDLISAFVSHLIFSIIQ